MIKTGYLNDFDLNWLMWNQTVLFVIIIVLKPL